MTLLALAASATTVAAAPPAAAYPLARPALVQPYDVLALPNGHLVVSDLPANAVYDLDPIHHSGRRLARVAQARELQRLVGSSQNGTLFRIERGRSRTIYP